MNVILGKPHPVWMVLFGFVLVGCVSTPPARTQSAGAPAAQAASSAPATQPTQSLDDYFSGAGTDVSMLAAMNRAKMDAVRKAVRILVGGESKERLYQDVLDNRLYNTSNPNQFVQMNTFERTRVDRAGEQYIFEARMKLNIDAIRRVLEANNIPVVGQSSAPAAATSPASSGSQTSGPTQSSGPAPAAPPATADLNIRQGDYEATTEDEARIIRRMVDNLTYMVFYPENSSLSPQVLRQIVTAANQYLVNNRVQLVDLDAAERVKADQRRVYEDQNFRDITLTQWVAQQLNADVYVEISANIVETVNDRRQFLARGSFEAKVYDPSTGRLLGSVSFNQLNAAMSPVSIDLARTNLIQNTVTQELMPRVIEQTRGYMAQNLQRGIRYEVVFQNTSDARLMAQFRRALQRRVKSLNVLTQSNTESKYEIFFIGTASELEEAVYKAADTVPGLEGIYNVMIRGRNLTFNTGLN